MWLKPFPGPLDISIDEPLARGLLFDMAAADATGPPRDTVTRQAATTTTPSALTWSASPVGPARDSTVQGGTQHDQFTLSRPFDWSRPWSVEVWTYLRSFQASGPHISAILNIGNALIFRFGDLGGPGQMELTMGGAKIVSATTYAPLQLAQFVGTYDGSNVLSLYGSTGGVTRLEASASIGTLGPTGQTSVSLFVDDSGRAPDGMVPIARIYAGVCHGLTQVMALAEDPGVVYGKSSPRQPRAAAAPGAPTYFTDSLMSGGFSSMAGF